MSIIESLRNKLHISNERHQVALDNTYEFCTKCEANLTLQKGYSNALPYWICKGCGEMLINPELDTDTIWLCDECNALLNTQEGFTETVEEWKCTECGFINKINDENLYLTEDEYQADKDNPYKGLSDADIIELMKYEEIEDIPGRQDINVICDESGKKYVRKFLKTYDKSVYEYLMRRPISNMPKIVEIYESDTCLIVIEEHITGETLDSILEKRRFDTNDAVDIVRSLCKTLRELHKQNPPIIHRDVKPSNIMISDKGDIILLDMNVAKWMDASKGQDTRLLGSMHYAAPEQFGYGFSSSNTKTDIYAIGVLLNVMIKGKYPQEEKATGSVWNIIEKCMKMNPEERYSDDELIEVLGTILE